MPTPKFFRIPFALSGDQATIPDALDPGGAVSFTQGFGPDYELEIGVDPDAKPVPRDETNYLYYEITNALNTLQGWGAADFITSAMNDGVAYSYGLGAMVKFAFAATPTVFQTYASLVQGNTTSPESSPASWQALGVASSISFASSAELEAGVVSTKAIAPDTAKIRLAYLSGAAFTGAVTGPSFTTPSDIRLKDNVQPYAGPKGDGLRLVTWTWNADAPGDLAGTDDSGVIAQDVQKDFPSCVYTDKNGILHVNYAKLAVHLYLAGRG